jgi:hypothetical protein
MTLRLICFENDSISDIKEQSIGIGQIPSQHTEMYLRGYGQALAEIFKTLTLAEAYKMMPEEFYPAPFELKRAKTSDDYRDGFLAKSRLGKFLPQP